MHVPGNEQIEFPVPVVVGPGGPGTKTSDLQACFFRNIFKPAATKILIQNVVSESRDVQIRQTIVIEVTDGDSHSPTSAREPSVTGNVAEVKASLPAILVI